MKVEILKNTVASGERLEKGETYDLDDRDAQYLIKSGKALISVNNKVKPLEKKEAKPPVKIKVLKDTMASGERLKKGKTYSVSANDADVLVAMRKAEIVGPAEEPPEVSDSKEPETPDDKSKGGKKAGGKNSNGK